MNSLQTYSTVVIKTLVVVNLYQIVAFSNKRRQVFFACFQGYVNFGWLNIFYEEFGIEGSELLLEYFYVGFLFDFDRIEFGVNTLSVLAGNEAF